MNLVEVVIDSLVMLLVLMGSFYMIYVKRRNEEEQSPNALKRISQFLIFGAINSFFVGKIFGVIELYWITLYCILTLVIFFKKETVGKYWTVAIVTLVIMLFLMYRVPTHPDAFEDYINSKEDIECHNHYQFECVKISYSTLEELETKTEVVLIQDYSFDWYVFFAKGSIKIGNTANEVEEINSINIAGFWIDYGSS